MRFPPQGIVVIPHELTHILGGADDIDAALNALAIALTTQGDIPYRAAALNTLARLAPGVAGQALITGGPAANPLWGAPAPVAHAVTHEPAGADEVNDIDIQNTGVLLSGHEARHPLGGADEIDAALNALAIALANQGDLVYRAAALNTLAALAPGTAGQLLITGGAGANPAWNWSHLLDNYPDADHSGNGLTSVDTVGENVVAGEVLYMAATGKYLKANAGAVGTMPAKVIAMEDILADAAGLLLHEGYYRDESWAWVLGAGEANLLFVTTVAGDLVQFAAKPAAAGNQVQVCGYVVTAKVIYFDPSYELVEIS